MRMVICRIGSLEIGHIVRHRTDAVICRIGSLESKAEQQVNLVAVICRIGSLEIKNTRERRSLAVICRIGSLERDDLALPSGPLCYLPYRQLRNLSKDSGSLDGRYLPYRQLRKKFSGVFGISQSEIPNTPENFFLSCLYGR